jgi:glutaredoxin
VFWQPGCSSCTKAKEFVAELGFEFESVNVLDDPAAMKEIEAAGLRSIPAVRRGTRYIYAQSLDDIAELLGVFIDQVRMTQSELMTRWDNLLGAGKSIVLSFDEEVLRRRVVRERSGTVAELGAHVYRIVESFIRQVEDDSIDARAIYLARRQDIESRRDLQSYIELIRKQYRVSMTTAAGLTLPRRLRAHSENNRPSLRSQCLALGTACTST